LDVFSGRNIEEVRLLVMWTLYMYKKSELSKTLGGIQAGY
jgi:hypothetical protein